MEQTTPTVGRVLHYRLHANDVQRILYDRNRADSLHRGNHPREGDLVPLHVVKVWPDEYAHFTGLNVDSQGRSWPVEGPAGINGQAILDGNDSIWVTSAGEGDGPGQWRWPPRAA